MLLSRAAELVVPLPWNADPAAVAQRSRPMLFFEDDDDPALPTPNTQEFILEPLCRRQGRPLHTLRRTTPLS